jgi:hypothetical protein
MSLSGINTGSPPSIADLLKQRRQDLQTMEGAVQSGDMTAAQQALANMQTDSQNLQSALGSAAGQGNGNPYQSSVKTDLTSLVMAAQSGGNGGTMEIFVQIQESPQAPLTGAASGAPSAAPSNDPQSAFMSDLQSLISAVQSGDMNGAQTAATALQKDMQASGVGHHHHHGGGGETSAASSTNSSSAASDTLASVLAGTSATGGTTTDSLTTLLSAVSA